MTKVETIIVGGGPAGSSAAKELVAAGRDVLLFDRKEFPRLKLCGGWITPEAMRRLGITLEDYPLRINRLSRMQVHTGRKTFAVKTEQYSVSRIEFDDWLLRRSKVSVVTENITQIVERDGEYILNDNYACRYLIGAGGTACPVARAFFNREDKERRNISARELEFDTEVLSDECHLWWPDGLRNVGYAWYVPKQNGRINIGVGGVHARVENLDAWWSWLVTQCLEKGLLITDPGKPKSHAYYLRGKKPSGRFKNVFIAGDALGLATLDLAEGIDAAVESGQMAARAILTSAPYAPRKIAKYSLPWGGLLRRIPAVPMIRA